MRALSLALSIFVLSIFNLSAEPVDLTVLGKGYIPMSLRSGELAYVKSGRFAVNGDSILVLMSGNLPMQAYPVSEDGAVGRILEPISLSGAEEFHIQESGNIIIGRSFLVYIGEPPQLQTQYKKKVAYQIPLAHFKNEENLTMIGSGIYQPNEFSGPADFSMAVPGKNRIVRGTVLYGLDQLSFSVSGRGFFTVRSSDGDFVYTRNIDVFLNFNGLSTPSRDYTLMGHLVDPTGVTNGVLQSVHLDPYTRYVFQRDGTITAFYSNSTTMDIAVIPITTFVGEDFLTPIGGRYFKENPSSGSPQTGFFPMNRARGEVVVK